MSTKGRWRGRKEAEENSPSDFFFFEREKEAKGKEETLSPSACTFSYKSYKFQLILKHPRVILQAGKKEFTPTHRVCKFKCRTTVLTTVFVASQH